MKKHNRLGRKTVHHLVPRIRLRDYYGTGYSLPYNKLKLWEFKHICWHYLFRLKTINEIIAYLNRRDIPHGYKSPAWQVVFGNKTSKQARSLLIRMRRMVRKQYEHFELDPMLRAKVKIYQKKFGANYVTIHVNKKHKYN